jgi:hypothetical protein
MPRVLTMTQKPGETPQQFAARISKQATTFFGESPQPDAETPPSTDVSADEAAPEEPAPAP